MNGRRSIIAHCFGIKVWLLNACGAETAKQNGHRTMWLILVTCKGHLQTCKRLLVSPCAGVQKKM